MPEVVPPPPAEISAEEKPQLIEPLGDPTTGEVVVVLADGVSRRLLFDFHAFRVMEEVTGVPFFRTVVGAKGLALLPMAAAIYAGHHRFARAASSKWTVEMADDLILLESLPALRAALAWALDVALAKLDMGAEKFKGEQTARACRGAGEQR